MYHNKVNLNLECMKQVKPFLHEISKSKNVMTSSQFHNWQQIPASTIFVSSWFCMEESCTEDNLGCNFPLQFSLLKHDLSPNCHVSYHILFKISSKGALICVFVFCFVFYFVMQQFLYIHAPYIWFPIKLTGSEPCICSVILKQSQHSILFLLNKYT